MGWREKIYLLNFFLVQMVLMRLSQKMNEADVHAGWWVVAAIALLGLGIRMRNRKRAELPVLGDS